MIARFHLILLAALFASCQLFAAFNGVPQVRLPERGTNVEAYWDTHPYNPKNRAGYNATTNPMPPVLINSPGRDADGKTAGCAVPGKVVNLASGGDILAAITANAAVINGKNGNVTIILAPNGVYHGFDMHGMSNIHIICPTATNNATVDTRPIIDSPMNLTFGLISTDRDGNPITFTEQTYYQQYDAVLDSDPTGTNAAWQLWRNPASNYYFKNVRLEHPVPLPGQLYMDALHTHFWHLYDVLIDNCTILSPYPTQALKHHRGSIMSNMGCTNISFIDCDFKGNSENSLYFDGAHCTTLFNCIFRLDPDTDPNNTNPDGPDAVDPQHGCNAGPTFLTNDDFTEGMTFAPFNTIDYVEELNAKYTVISGCTYQGSGNRLLGYSGDDLLFLNNNHTANPYDGNPASINYAIYFCDGAAKGKRDFDPTFNYNYANFHVIGNTIGTIFGSSIFWFEHPGEILAVPNNLASYMGGYRIAGNSIASSKALVLEGIPDNQRVFWHDAGIVGGNVQNGNGTLDSNYGLDRPAPSQPTGLVVSAFSASETDLEWADNSNEETSYFVERSLTGTNGTWTRVNSLRMNSTSYADSGMTPSTTYYYRIGANSDYGVTYSATANVTTFVAGMPSTPSCLVATAISSNSTLLTWIDNSDNETSFAIERSPSGANGTWTGVGTAGNNTTTFRDATAGLQRATTYYYRVSATNSNVSLTSRPSDVAHVTTLASNPNLVNNGSFETTTTASPYPANNWLARSYLVRDATMARTGAASWCASNTGSGVSVYSYSQLWGPLEPNTSYTLSAFVRSAGVTSGTGFKMEVNAGAPAVTLNSTASVLGNVSQWQEMSCVFITGGNATTGMLRLWCEVNAGKAWIDDVIIRKNDPSLPAPSANISDLAATTLDDARITLTWTDNGTTESEYRIERSLTGVGSWTEVGRVGENATFFTDSVLSGLMTYYYRICAANGGGVSAYSNTATGITSDPTPPIAPSSLAVIAPSTDQARLVWVDASQNENYFQIERSSTSALGPFTQVASAPANSVNIFDNGLTAGTNYWYRVRAVNTTSPSSYSNVVGVTTPSANPNLIGNPSFESSGTNYWNSSWLVADSAVVKDGLNSLKATSTNGSMSTYTNYGSWGPLEPNTAYHLEGWVLSTADISGGLKLDLNYGAAVSTGWSVANSVAWQKISANFTTSAAIPTTGTYLRIYDCISAGNAWLDALQLVKTGVAGQSIPSAPTSLAASNPTGSTINLSWADNSTNETGFNIERSLTGTSGWTQVAMAPAGATSFTDGGLGVSTSYYYRICAFHYLFGNSAYSSTASATTLEATRPGTPVGTTATALGDTSIQVTWTDTSDMESGFEVVRSADGAEPWTLAGTTSSNVVSFVDTGIPANTLRFYRVRSVNAAGNSSYSTTTSARTMLANQAVNGSAETDCNSDSIPDGWTILRMSWDSSMAHSSTHSLRGSFGTLQRPETVTLPAPATLEAGVAYTAELWFRMVGVTSGSGLRLGFHELAADGSNRSLSTTGNYTLENSGNWSLLTLDFVTRADHQKGAVVAQIDLGAGSIWLDDFILRKKAVELPLAPSNLTASATAYNSIALTWSDASSDETLFRIERSATSNGTWIEIGSVTANTTAYIDSSLAAATTAYYRVRAFNGAGGSAYTATASATTPDIAPSGLAGSSITGGIAISWTDNCPDETGFLVSRSTDNSTWTPIATPASNAITYTDTTVVNGSSYYYRVQAARAAGNTSWSNVVLIAARADNFTQNFVSTAWDLNNKRVTFTPVGNSYSTQAETVAAFETDTSSGTALSLGDDSNALVSLTGGKTVPFFGTPYSSFYVGSNGYITFGSGDTGYSVSDAQHFAYKRISLLFRDLNPSAGGSSVKYVQTADRIAVTYSVIKFGGSALNNIQLEMFFNGVIRITWLAVPDGAGSIVGLSNGGGQPGTYVSPGSDFTTYPAPTQNIPTAPTSPTATALSMSSIRVGWADQSSTETGFQVERGTSSSGPWTSVATTAANAVTYTDTGLSGSTTYYYRIAATNAGADSSYTATVSATTLLDTVPPMVSSAVATSSTQVLVTFNEAVEAASANVAGNYAIPGVSVLAAARQTDTGTVALTVSTMTAGSYTVTVTGVRDIFTNTIATSNTATFTYSDLPSAGIMLWLKADAGITQSSNAVSSWTSQGGNSTVASQALGTSQPLFVANAVNGKPVVRFDGIDDSLAFSGLNVNGLTGMTLFLVSATSNGTQNPTAGNTSSATRSAVFWNEVSPGWGTVFVSPYQAAVRYRFGTGTNQSGALPDYTRPASIGGNFSVTSVTHNSTAETLHINGASVYSQTGKTAAIGNCDTTGYVGRGYGTSLSANATTCYSGDIAEVIVYDRALSDTERQAVEGYLNIKYFSTAPAITAQPGNATVAAGASTTFIVAATGNPPPTYQWRKDGTNISGATSASLTVANAQAANAGNYTVVVSNSAGNVISDGAILNVSAAVAPSITAQPASASVAVGASVSFTVNATGSPSPTYQWRRNGSNISGATNATFTISSVQLADAGNYAAFVSNIAGNATSSTANLGVAVPDPFATWAAARGLSGNSALALADPDGDGRSNLLEYALGSNPSASDNAAPTIDAQAGYLRISFNVDSAKTDMIYAVQASDDLITWTDIAQSTGGTAFTPISARSTIIDSGSGVRTVTVTDASLLATRRFLRLKVAKP